VARDRGWTRSIGIPPQPLVMCCCRRVDGKLSRRLITATLNQQRITLLQREEFLKTDGHLDTTTNRSVSRSGGSFAGRDYRGDRRPIGGFGGLFDREEYSGGIERDEGLRGLG